MREVREIAHGSAQYHQTLALREQVLRLPIGLVLSEDDTVDDHRQRHFVMLDGEHLLACVTVKPLGATSAKLRQMAVSPQYQGLSIGRQLILEVERLLLDDAVAHVEMSARHSAVGFYQKLGYHAVGESYIEQGVPHVRMEKRMEKAQR